MREKGGPNSAEDRPRLRYQAASFLPEDLPTPKWKPDAGTSSGFHLSVIHRLGKTVRAFNAEGGPEEVTEGISPVARAAPDQPEGQQCHGPLPNRRPGQRLDPAADVVHDGRGQQIGPKLDVHQRLPFRPDRQGGTKIHSRGFRKMGEKVLDRPHYGVDVVLQRFRTNATPQLGRGGQEVYLRRQLPLRQADIEFLHIFNCIARRRKNERPRTLHRCFPDCWTEARYRKA